MEQDRKLKNLNLKWIWFFKVKAEKEGRREREKNTSMQKTADGEFLSSNISNQFKSKQSKHTNYKVELVRSDFLKGKNT